MQDEKPMTPIETVALYCPNDSAALAQLRADAQALADVRTLDEWARECFGGWNTAPGFRAEWYRCSVYNAAMTTKTFDGRTPDEARAKAAAWARGQAKGAPEPRPCSRCGEGTVYRENYVCRACSND